MAATNPPPEDPETLAMQAPSLHGPGALARGKAFTDKLLAARARTPSGTPEFDRLCAELGAEPGIEHRLTKPKSPQSETDPETVRASVFPANGQGNRVWD